MTVVPFFFSTLKASWHGCLSDSCASFFQHVVCFMAWMPWENKPALGDVQPLLLSLLLSGMSSLCCCRSVRWCHSLRCCHSVRCCSGYRAFLLTRCSFNVRRWCCVPTHAVGRCCGSRAGGRRPAMSPCMRIHTRGGGGGGGSRAAMSACMRTRGGGFLSPVQSPGVVASGTGAAASLLV